MTRPLFRHGIKTHISENSNPDFTIDGSTILISVTPCPGPDLIGQGELHRSVSRGSGAARCSELSGGGEQGCAGHLDTAVYDPVREDYDSDRAAVFDDECEGGQERGAERGFRVGAGRGWQRQPGD